MAAQTRIALTPAQFSERERPLLTFGSLSATTWRYDSGVEALRLQNAHGRVELLPFLGQQIWSVTFGGRELTMRSMFDAPRPTPHFLETFGGFLQHCGVTGAGGPGPEDTHLIHGELPTARYQSAYLVTGEDGRGAFVGLGGHYRHTVAFGPDYLAEPLVKLYARETLVNVSMTITNRKRSPLELMYLAHVNFRPVDHGRVVTSARTTPETMRVRQSIPAHITPKPGYAEFLQQLAADPGAHAVFVPGQAFDPEVVLFIDCLADADGWAYALQVHPDGTADMIRHRPSQLPKATRWICRTADQDAVALLEVGTCEPEGYTAEKRKGNIRVLNPGAAFHAEFEAGWLDADAAGRLEALVDRIVAGA